MVEQTPTRIRAEAYFQLPEYAQHDLIQLIDGEVVIGMLPIPRHQAIVREILVLFALRARQTGGTAYSSPIEVYLDEHNVFEPDVLYLTPDSACQIGEKRLTGAPNLIVEVLSPSTTKYDREKKYHAYQRHGVDEYWIVDPANEAIEVYTLDADGAFVRQGVFIPGDSFDSRTLGESVAVKTIFA